MTIGTSDGEQYEDEMHMLITSSKPSPTVAEEPSTTPQKQVAAEYGHLNFENLPVKGPLPKVINEENFNKMLESQKDSTNIEDRRDMPFEFSAPDVARALQDVNTFDEYAKANNLSTGEQLNLIVGLNQSGVKVPRSIADIVRYKAETDDMLQTLSSMGEHAPKPIPFKIEKAKIKNTKKR